MSKQGEMKSRINTARMKYLLKINDRYPEARNLPNINDWAEANKYNPAGYTKYPGMHDRTTAPHMQEILDFFDPENPLRWGSLLKGVQSTGTYHAETAIAYYIAHKLGSIGLYTASQELAREISSSRIDPLIDNTNLAGNVKPHSARNARKRADSTFYKEFAGGIKMVISSYGTISSMKSHSLNLIILDEVDEAPADLKDQGDPIRIIEGRTITMDEYKIFELSTPTRMETSRIYAGFLKGDQRRYKVPCPLCGEKEELVMKIGKRDYGLTFDFETNKNGERFLIDETVRYICKHCKKSWQESKKQKAMLAGNWVPTAKPVDPTHTSWRVSGLMSPEPFLSWKRICRELVKCNFGKNISEYKNFTINYLGQPWGRVESKADWEKLKKNALDYPLGGTPPGGPMILFGGVDVQKDRLEIAVVGVGPGMESWLIDYEVVHGDTTAYLTWDKMIEYVTKFRHVKLGGILETGIDTGYDPRQSTVRTKDFAGKSSFIYDVCGRRPDFLCPVRGAGEDWTTGEIVKRVRLPNQRVPARYDIQTAVLKEILFQKMKDPNGPLVPHFPRWREFEDKKYELEDHVYKSFCSERYQEIAPKKMGWKKTYQRNEVLDTYIYALGMAYKNYIHQLDTPEFWKPFLLDKK